jgi:hypothetical protein
MDLKIIETGNGGDAVLGSSDLSVIYGFENMPYLAMFGGNVEASTPSERPENSQAFDWWGNDLLLKNEPKLQFNSETERTLKNVALSSTGRNQIEQAVKYDLSFMNDFAEPSIETAITAPDRLEISVQIKQPDNLADKLYVFIWDATKQDLE